MYFVAGIILVLLGVAIMALFGHPNRFVVNCGDKVGLTVIFLGVASILASAGMVLWQVMP